MQYTYNLQVLQDISANNEKQILFCEPNLVAECANLRLSASEASGQTVHPWDFLQEIKNSLKNRESFQNCCDLEPLYNKVRTHFITQSR